MKFELVELSDYTGPKAVIYSVIVEGDQETLFERFVRENIENFPYEVNDILSLIEDIGYKYGAREHFFKLNEGKPGDGVCAIYDDPDHNLRLYCILSGTDTVILGGGGFKPKEIKAYQEDPKLDAEASIVKFVSHKITQAIKDKELLWDGPFLDGEITFEEEE